MRIKYLVTLAAAFLMLASCTSVQKENEPVYYKNPVIKGDLPDPSVIRVGDKYYAVGTTNDFAPVYPLFESTDLINWTSIGAVFNEPPAWALEDFWAPELYYNNGTFFVYYTTKRKDTGIACIGVATTKDIHKGFTDQGIIIEWGDEAIDAFIFKDDDGKLYITWKAYGLTPDREIQILASELSDDGLSLVGEHFSLTDQSKGWQGPGHEGQCLIKRNGYYYLFNSAGGCCDNRCDYHVLVARSKNLREGWEQFPEPILHGGETWRCTGHGTLVETPAGRYFYMYHSYNATDFEFIGRQVMLDEMLWNEETGWPYFKGGTPSEKAPVPFENTIQKVDSVYTDDFSTDKNLAGFEWDVKGVKFDSKIEAGELVISTQESGAAFLGLRPETGNYSLMSEVIPAEELSGIGIYGNQGHVLSLAVDKSKLVLYQINKGEEQILAEEKLNNPASVFLKYEAVSGRYFQFFWSENGEDWLPVVVNNEQQVDGTFLAQWGFAPRVGFVTRGNEKSAFRFSTLEIKYNY
ncbi:family 43 glycosylhydrolase [Draconibacterium sediminis]|uniref:family 43 glycosylhydrolase n=1 Tax=Draconibacterium sediminis TaxID=1544798 RepID=UPI00069735B4|nr:family 43 glycosylhydrolase [Draconibacterium sediminis]